MARYRKQLVVPLVLAGIFVVSGLVVGVIALASAKVSKVLAADIPHHPRWLRPQNSEYRGTH